MADTTQQDGQKTIVAFIVGLLIGGMLVWAFSGPAPTVPDGTNQPTDTESTNNADAAEDNEANEGVAPANGDTATGSTATEPAPRPTLPMGDGSVRVANQPASRTVTLESATFPISEGWIGVRDFENEQLGMILGVVRFSEADGLVPTDIILQRSTTPGRQYAVVIFTEDGDRAFNLATDVQIDQIFATFTAQ